MIPCNSQYRKCPPQERLAPKTAVMSHRPINVGMLACDLDFFLLVSGGFMSRDKAVGHVSNLIFDSCAMCIALDI